MRAFLGRFKSGVRSLSGPQFAFFTAVTAALLWFCSSAVRVAGARDFAAAVVLATVAALIALLVWCICASIWIVRKSKP